MQARFEVTKKYAAAYEAASKKQKGIIVDHVVAVDTLGHDERSFDSEGHRSLLQTLLSWLTLPATDTQATTTP